MTHVLATPALKPERVECAVAESRLPQIMLGRIRKHCATCQIRKTLWLIRYGEESRFQYTNPRCWNCMTPEERQAFRDEY